jgi:periplasmic protein TonB
VTGDWTSRARVHSAPGASASASQRVLRLRGLGLCVGAAVAMHLAVLTLRPAVTGAGSVVTSAVMLVRMLQPAAAAPALVSAEAPVRATLPAEPAPTSSSRSETPTRRPALPMPASRPPRTVTEPAPIAAVAPQDARAAVPARAASVADAPLAAAPDYLLGARLDPGPRPLEDIEPDYPDTVRLREGTVVLRLLIGNTGHVDDVAVVRSDPRGVFDQAALDAFGKARFAPGLLAGTPVKSQITVEVEFMPINRGARVSGRSY